MGWSGTVMIQGIENQNVNVLKDVAWITLMDGNYMVTRKCTALQHWQIETSSKQRHEVGCHGACRIDVGLVD
jgi:hypothetical protein